MAVIVLTEDQLLALAIVYLQAAYPGKPIGPKSFLGQQARSLAQLAGAIMQAVQAADDDGVPAYDDRATAIIRSRCSSQALDNWAVTFGLPSNLGNGRFGRNGPVVARGGAGNVTGPIGSTQGAHSVLVSSAAPGQIQVELINGLTIPGGGSISGQFQATSAGADGNLPAGTTLQFVSPGPGIFPFVTLTTALSGGYDSESDLHLLERLIDHLRDPPKGGTAHDYRVWAEGSLNLSTLATLGISRAYVYPFRDGAGSEDIVITQAGQNGVSFLESGRNPGPARQVLCQAYIDSVRPVNDTPTVILPQFDPARGLSIVAQVQPAADYLFDWVMTGSFALAGIHTRTTLLVNAATLADGQPGAALRHAFLDGKQPRIQLVLPDSPLPQVRRVISMTGIGTLTLTLDSPLSSVPSFAQPIFPGGGAVMPAAVALQGYVDSIGPSKQCGFYDNVTDDWEALVSIGKLAWAALDAEDALGKKVLQYSPGVGQGVGITVAVGVGAPAAADVPLFDNTPPHTNGPELPWTQSILVLPIQ